MCKEKLDNLIASSKINNLLNKKGTEVKEKKNNWILVVLAIIGAVAAVAAIAYAVYRYFTPDYLDDFDDDDFDDDFDEDDFEDEDKEEKNS